MSPPVAAPAPPIPAPAVRTKVDGGRAWPFDPAGAQGKSPFRAKSGAEYRSYDATNIGNGLVRVDADCDGLLIDDVYVGNAYRALIECDAGKSLSNFVVSNSGGVGIERSLIRLRGKSTKGLIKTVTALADGQSGPAIPFGIHFEEECSWITVEDALLSGFAVGPGRDYGNGDGLCDERNCHDMTYRRVSCWKNADGGFDLKSQRVTLEDCTAGANKRNFRLWGDGKLTGRTTSIDPLWAHIAFHGPTRPTYVIDFLYARGSNPATQVLFSNAPAGIDIVIRDHDIQVAPGTQLVMLKDAPASASRIQWIKPAPKVDRRGMVV